jgi:Family of unknown function (DUF5906)/Primase C terminal 2 (PriCT-2)
MSASVQEFCRSNNIQLTAVRFSPYYAEKKGRISKGDVVCHPKWKDKGRYEDKHTRFTPQTKEERDSNEPVKSAHAWMMYLKKGRIFAIDFDVHHPSPSFCIEDGINGWKEFYEGASYVVRTGSGGLHVYFEMPELEEGDQVKSVTDCVALRNMLIHPDYHDKISIDIIVDSIIVEGSIYSYEGVEYSYKALKGAIEDIMPMPEKAWTEMIAPYIVHNAAKEKAKTEQKKKEMAIETMKNDVEHATQALYMKPSAEEVAEHLANIPNTKANWQRWYELAQALFNEDYEFDLFDEFSKRCLLYDARVTFQLWRGLKKEDRGRKLSVGTVFYHSKEANPTGYKEIRSRYKPASYYTLKTELEQTHFFIQEPKPRYIRINDDGYIVEYTCNEFKEMLANYPSFSMGQPLKKPFYDILHQDPMKRTYNSLGYYPNPSKCPSHVYNIYRPPIASTYEEGKEPSDLKPIMDHIALLTNELDHPEKDRIGARFLIQFMAQIVQQPDVLPGLCIVMYGEEGAGKDLLWVWFGELLGRHLYTMCGSVVNLFKQFNAKLEGKLLCHLTEIDLKKMSKYEEDLKRIIDSKVYEIEKKGKDSTKEPMNYLRLVMTTNNRDSLKISVTDRRIIAYEASSEKISDPSYYATLVNTIYTHEFMATFYNYLLTVDISGFCHQNRPHTKLYKEMKQSSIKPFLEFLNDLSDEETKEAYSIIQWLTKYNNWAEERRHFPTNSTRLGTWFNEWETKIKGGFEHTKPQNKSMFKVNISIIRTYLIEKEVVAPSDPVTPSPSVPKLGVRVG